jgi:hypothetical protein
LDPDALEDFFFYGLAFVLPGKVLGPGSGVGLSFAESCATTAVSPDRGSVWVWPFESGPDEGIRIAPLHENLGALLREYPNWREFFSCLEILRFQGHALRIKARERLRPCLPAPRANGPDASEESSLRRARLVGAAAKIVAETGYRTTLKDLGRKAGLAPGELESEFASPAELSGEIARACAARANAHFGKLLLARPEFRAREARESLASFLQFLDSNEDYFRLGLWHYLERMFDRTQDSGLLAERFFQGLEDFFAEIPSARSARARAMVFANAWLSYAWFRWIEYPKMQDRGRADARLHSFRDTFLDLLA